MARSLPQLEFKWSSLLRALKAPAAPKSKPVSKDDDLTAWCVQAATGLGLPQLAGKVRVSWNPRMRTTAGRAWWPDRLIELNPKLRECGGDDEVWRTLKHELAHLVAYERCGRRRIEPHGAEWQAACADLGIPDERTTHSLPFERRKMTRKHAYTCPNCSATICRVRAIRRAVACHDCCRKFNGGVYHDRYRLKKVPL